MVGQTQPCDLFQFSLFCLVALGQCLAKNKINLIYGGGTVGLMGTIAKTMSDEGCEVTGFLPEFFLKKSKHNKLLIFIFNDVEHRMVRFLREKDA